MSISYSVRLALVVLACWLGGISMGSAQYVEDILGSPYQATYLPLRSGDRATLVRRTPLTNRRAVLYVHGYNDYFFQTSLGDSISRHGYDFYALDLRRYGRSLRSGDRLFECKDVRVYQEEIGLAIRQIRQEGHEDIYLMAHSTGCLISALYLHDTDNVEGIKGLMLNSPFIDYQSTWFNERVLLPLVTAVVAPVLPNMVIIPESKQVEPYAQSLLAEYRGLWAFDQNWKRPQGYPIRASWLRAIKRGHRRVQAGLNLQLPILLMSSTRSILPSDTWQEDYASVDLVLDVKDMWRFGAKLGREVQFTKIPNGIHDLILSPDQSAREATYRTIFDWLNRVEQRAEVR